MGEELELTLLEVYEAVMAVKEVVDVIDEATKEAVNEEAMEVIVAYGDNSDEPNTDVEQYLYDIKNALMYDEENTSLQEISARLEVIDTRLDTEFVVLNEFYGLCGCTLLTIVSIKFFSWLTNTFSP